MTTYHFVKVSIMTKDADLGSFTFDTDVEARKNAIAMLSHIPNKELAPGLYDVGIAIVKEGSRRKQTSIARVGKDKYAILVPGKYGDLDIVPLNKNGTLKE